MKTVILDFGHGGMINGEYQTCGKRSPSYNGKVYYEGVGNRMIGALVIEQLNDLGIPYLIVSDQQSDNSLDNRCIRANHFYDTVSTDCFLVSNHSNAGGGCGSEFFKFRGSVKGLEYAKVFEHYYKDEFLDYKNRGIKTANFQMLRDTKMPAVLLEFFFMDNEYECKNFLMRREGRALIANCITRSIVHICKSTL